MSSHARIPIAVRTRVQWRTTRTDDNVWVGVCDPLNLIVEAESQSELVEAAEQAMTLLIHDLIEDDDFDEFLKKKGWKLLIPLPKKMSGVRFDVPLELVMKDEIAKVRSKRVRA